MTLEVVAGPGLTPSGPRSSSKLLLRTITFSIRSCRAIGDEAWWHFAQHSTNRSTLPEHT